MDYLERAFRYISDRRRDRDEEKEIRETRRESEREEKQEVPQRRRILTRYETLGDIQSSIDPFGKKRLGEIKFVQREERDDKIKINEKELLKDRTCNDPITLEHQDDDAQEFISDAENKDHFLFIGQIDKKYYIDCAYRDNLRYIIGNAKYRCGLDQNYYTVTTSFDPYLKISEKDIDKILTTDHKIYYLTPTEMKCGNGMIFTVKICGGEDCLQKIFS